MNERIQLLAEQATTRVDAVPNESMAYTYFDTEKFARLIVAECIDKIENEAAQYAEPVWAFELVNDIKEHFGVEE